MFDDLRTAFREALENFRTELNRDAVPDAVDGILRDMGRELAEARTRLKGIEADLDTARLRVRAEEEAVATTARRRQLAAGIGDGETERVAAEYQERHEQRLAVFRQKASALEGEVRLLSAEVEEMTARLQEARTSRDELAAQAGRTRARESLGESDDLFETLRRMEARIEGDDAEEAAAREIDRELGRDPGSHGRPSGASDLRVELDDAVPAREIDYDAVLAELKRRMGKE
ncbi:MAG: hypothetical protein RQ751_05900 [Longimicrobiales bacterium]|nr:hypothetical protein [Longimicrobiales bacterium]